MSAVSTPVTIEAFKLTKRFQRFTAVDSVSLQIHQGQVVGLVGPNGSGKTTLVRMLCGIIQPTAGSGRVMNFDIVSQADRLKHCIGYVSQRFSLYDELTTWENLSFYAGIYGLVGEKGRFRLEEVVHLVGLEGLEHRLASSLAMGWRQRLALGCAILHHPQILFLDEPTAGVDPTARRQFWDIIYAIAAQRVTVLVTTHHMEEAEQCDRVALMHQGQILAYESPDGLKAHYLGGQITEVECSDVLAGLDVAQKVPGVVDVTLHGTLLHLTLDSPEQVLPRVQAAFSQARLPLTSLRPIAPTLEDAFYAILRASMH